MDIILELLVEIIVDGSIEAASSKRVPKWIRICLGAFVVLLFLFLCTVVLIEAADCVRNKAWVGLGILLILLLILGFFLWKTIKKMRNRA